MTLDELERKAIAWIRASEVCGDTRTTPVVFAQALRVMIPLLRERLDIAEAVREALDEARRAA